MHNVQSVNKGKMPYFELTVQTKSAARKTLCYSPRKKSKFEDAMTSKSPVKLKNFAINKGTIFLNDNVNVSMVDPTTVDFKHNPKLAKDVIVPLRELPGLASGQFVKIKAYVLKISEANDHHVRQGGIIKRKEVTVADDSTSLNLTLYGDDTEKLTLGKTYIMSNVRLNIAKNRCFLNSSVAKDFNAVECEPLQNTYKEDCDTTVKTVCNVVGVSNINSSQYCPVCNKKCQPCEDANLVTCNGCDSTLRTIACSTNWTLSLMIQDISSKEIFKVYFPNNQVQALCKLIDHNLVSDHFLSKCLLEITEPFFIEFDAIKNTVKNVKLPVEM